MPKFQVTVYERTLESIDLEVEAENEREAHLQAIVMLEDDTDGEYPDDARDWHGASEPVRVLVVLNGGCVSDVWASAPVKLEVFDWDDHDEDEGMEPQHEVDALRVGLTQVY